MERKNKFSNLSKIKSKVLNDMTFQEVDKKKISFRKINKKMLYLGFFNTNSSQCIQRSTGRLVFKRKNWFFGHS